MAVPVLSVLLSRSGEEGCWFEILMTGAWERGLTDHSVGL